MRSRTRYTLTLIAALGFAACADPTAPTPPQSDAASAAVSAAASNGVNVLLKSAPTGAIIADLNTIGQVLDVIPQLNAVTMRAKAAQLPAIRAKAYVEAAEVDGAVTAIPVNELVAPSDFSAGMSTWNLDAVNVTVSPGFTGRNPALGGLTGDGVYIGVLDTGLLRTWREYFPTDRIATQYARSFGGGGGDRGNVSDQPNKWEHDTDSHGTHVTSTIIGFVHPSGIVNGVAPRATIIPVKVLNQNGSGWNSVVAHGIIYMADLKAGELSGSPVVINMSLGGGPSVLVERAIDYAIARGVILVAAAGNAGDAGMHYPGAYPQMISVAAYGWIHEWETCGGSPVSTIWWRACDVAEPTNPADFYITTFSSRELPGQELDVAAPGSWVVGPYQLNSGQLSWFFVGGTSQATPHVTGIAALLAEQNPALNQSQAEQIIKDTAIPLGPGSRTVFNINTGQYTTVSWGANATGEGLVDAVAAVQETP
ncbi:MAG TPA: S8 family serine peptidase [Gemmatimonadaceae bacterium]|nr:S8 family serine peptidase [Gemmatimonadaceae bacterium]